MRKSLLLLGLAVVLVLAFATTAFAAESPHGFYSLTSEKCETCHTIHGAGSVSYNSMNAVTGSAWATGVGAPKTSAPIKSEMLLSTSVAQACEYCHIFSSLGGIALYQGNPNVEYYGVPNGVDGAPATFAPVPGKANTTETANYPPAGPATIMYQKANATSTPPIVAGQVRINFDSGSSVQYAADGSIYRQGGNATWPHYVSNPQKTGASIACTSCHSVHGAKTMQGAIGEKILKQPGEWTRVNARDNTVSAWNFQTTFIESVDGNFAAGVAYVVGSDNRDLQVTGFCTACHKNYYASPDQQYQSDPTLTSTDPTLVGSYKKTQGHPLKAADPTFGPSDAAGATYSNGPVAFQDSTYCTSCHRAGQLYVNGATSFKYNGGTTQTNTMAATGYYSGKPLEVYKSSFPHYTPNNAYFLTAATDMASPEVDVASNAAAGEDGVCLRCHRDGLGNGVGQTY